VIAIASKLFSIPEKLHEFGMIHFRTAIRRQQLEEAISQRPRPAKAHEECPSLKTIDLVANTLDWLLLTRDTIFFRNSGNFEQEFS